MKAQNLRKAYILRVFAPWRMFVVDAMGFPSIPRIPKHSASGNLKGMSRNAALYGDLAPRPTGTRGPRPRPGPVGSGPGNQLCGSVLRGLLCHQTVSCRGKGSSEKNTCASPSHRMFFLHKTRKFYGLTPPPGSHFCDSSAFMSRLRGIEQRSRVLVGKNPGWIPACMPMNQ